MDASAGGNSLCAAILMVYAANERPGAGARKCVLRVENQSAVAAIVKGSPPSGIAGVLANVFWNVAARGAARRWVGCVNAKSNWADLLSRQRNTPKQATCNLT